MKIREFIILIKNEWKAFMGGSLFGIFISLLSPFLGISHYIIIIIFFVVLGLIVSAYSSAWKCFISGKENIEEIKRLNGVLEEKRIETLVMESHVEAEINHLELIELMHFTINRKDIGEILERQNILIEKVNSNIFRVEYETYNKGFNQLKDRLEEYIYINTEIFLMEDLLFEAIKNYSNTGSDIVLVSYSNINWDEKIKTMIELYEQEGEKRKDNKDYLVGLLKSYKRKLPKNKEGLQNIIQNGYDEISYYSKNCIANNHAETIDKNSLNYKLNN